MNDAATILKMIEEVSPDDVLKLYEIDTRAWVWLQGYEVRSVTPTVGDDIGGLTFRYHKEFTAKDKGKPLSRNLMIDSEARFYPNRDRLKRFSTSRDALKEVRPEGIRNWQIVMGKRQTFGCGIEYPGAVVFESNMLPTEELAELHAIIQAVEHIRQTDPSYTPIKTPWEARLARASD